MTRLTKSIHDEDGDRAAFVGYSLGIYVEVQEQGELPMVAGPFTADALRQALNEVEQIAP